MNFERISFCSTLYVSLLIRTYFNSKAIEAFSVEQVIVDLKKSGVVHGKHNKKYVPEEGRFAYKDIEEVSSNELDLVTPIKKLSTVGVVKG
jgi:tRNA-splicing ligase RtcB (3'-phosphate/5'-hydroxy nucleic acid ligase)